MSGGEVRRLALLQAAVDPKAADISLQQLHRLWEGEQQAKEAARQPAQKQPKKEISQDEQVVRMWMEAAMRQQEADAAQSHAAGAVAAGAADDAAGEEQPRKSRKLKQDRYGERSSRG